MAESVKHKLLTFYSPSHKILFDKYFKPSFDEYLKDEFELIVFEGEQICKSGSYQEHGWNKSVSEKVKFVYNFIKNDKLDFFVFSDIDVEFFSSIKKQLVEELGSNDIAFQRDPRGSLCSGFFICKNDKKIKTLFEEIIENYNYNWGDQYNYNYMIKKSNVKYKFLSNKFFSIWRTINHYNSWKKGSPTIYPKYNISVLHANYAIGVKNKEKLLASFKKRDAFKKRVKKRVKKKYFNIIENLNMMSFFEYVSIYNEIISIKKCNLLIFGVRYDSKLWIEVNKEGNTVFLEDSEKWIKIAEKENSKINIFKVKYNTSIKNNNNYIKMYNNEETNFLKISLPLEIKDIRWDIILIDAPVAVNQNNCGRFQSLYAAYELSSNNTIIFIHDCNRFVEKIWTRLLFGDKYSQIDTLRRYSGR